MKPLIAVVTCHKNEIAAMAQRKTWVVGSPIEVKFFFGDGHLQESTDEVVLKAPDNYLGLPIKVQTMVRWARFRGYTHLFKCDDDAYLVPMRLLTSGFERHSYLGNMSAGYAHGGAGYWIDTTAMDAIISAVPEGKSEDGWVADTLRRKGILGYHDARYQYTRRVYKDPFPETPAASNDIILSAEFTPEEMKLVHRRWVNPPDPTDVMTADEYKRFLKGKHNELGY